MSGEILFRPATLADVTALSELGRDSFIAKFGHLYRQEDLLPFLADTFSETAIAREIADPERLYYLAEQDARLVGYCKLGIPSTLPKHTDAVAPIEIKQLYTASDMTGQGIGAKLMDWALAEARARAADEIQLSVWSGNHDGQRFYARYGFRKVADIHFRVGEQLDDEFLFVLGLRNQFRQG